jgi:hypothetical protein
MLLEINKTVFLWQGRGVSNKDLEYVDTSFHEFLFVSHALHDVNFISSALDLTPFFLYLCESIFPSSMTTCMVASIY